MPAAKPSPAAKPRKPASTPPRPATSAARKTGSAAKPAFAAKSAVKTAAKAAPTQVASRAPARKSAPAKAVKAVNAVKPTPAATTAQSPAAKPPKIKLVRDSFTIPRAEYEALDGIKARLVKLTHPAKKSEVLRAGIAVLTTLNDAALLAALEAVPAIKTGRPKKAK